MRIELDRVGKTYDGESWAVRNVGLDIPTGSIFGFIGPNGAGKSTTLRMIATVMDPTEGRVALDGQDAKENPVELRRQIGFLGDGNPLYKNMSPSEYLRFYGECFRMDDDVLSAAVDDTLETFDLVGKRDTPCGALSKGMRQRVLIARCLLHRPKLLILDEPADGLDPRGRSDLRRILHRVRERGVTIIISSHILRELDDMCDQVAIIQKGQLVVAGEVADIISRYEVARYVYDIRFLPGPTGAQPSLAQALEVLAAHRVLVESSRAEDGEGRGLIRAQVQGGEDLMAEILAQLVSAGVRVVTVSRQQSRLEDVYDKISDNRVN